jgi:hypothetical protein
MFDVYGAAAALRRGVLHGGCSFGVVAVGSSINFCQRKAGVGRSVIVCA